MPGIAARLLTVCYKINCLVQITMLQKLSLRVKELEETSVQDQDAPNIHDDDSLSVSSSNSQLQEQIDQLEFDRDELDAKYAELKVIHDFSPPLSFNLPPPSLPWELVECLYVLWVERPML